MVANVGDTTIDWIVTSRAGDIGDGNGDCNDDDERGGVRTSGAGGGNTDDPLAELGVASDAGTDDDERTATETATMTTRSKDDGGKVGVLNASFGDPVIACDVTSQSRRRR